VEAGASQVPVPAPTDSAVEAALDGARHLTVRSLLLGSGPRFARDAFGPLLVFYVGWRLAGLAVGIAAATALSLFALWYERRRERTARMALLSLGFVLFQAAVGLLSRSATLYLAQPVLLSAGFGAAFVASVALRRPLAGVFADEIFPFPPEVKESRTYRRVFSRISMAWGVYQLARSATRLLMLGTGTVEAFLAVNFVTGVPLTAALMSWSIWYAVRGFRSSEEWGWALRGEDPPADLVAAYEARLVADAEPLPATC
jgi:intracellular septation protein A